MVRSQIGAFGCPIAMAHVWNRGSQMQVGRPLGSTPDFCAPSGKCHTEKRPAASDPLIGGSL